MPLPCSDSDAATLPNGMAPRSSVPDSCLQFHRVTPRRHPFARRLRDLVPSFDGFPTDQNRSRPSLETVPNGMAPRPPVPGSCLQFRRVTSKRHPFARRLRDLVPKFDGFPAGQIRSREEPGNRTVWVRFSRPLASGFTQVGSAQSLPVRSSVLRDPPRPPSSVELHPKVPPVFQRFRLLFPRFGFAVRSRPGFPRKGSTFCSQVQKPAPNRIPFPSRRSAPSEDKGSRREGPGTVVRECHLARPAHRPVRRPGSATARA